MASKQSARLNVVLVAEESAGIQVLRRLADGPHRIVAVLTGPPAPGGKGATVGQAAERLGVPTMPSERVRDPELAAWMREESVDLLLNVHSLFIICPAVVEAPRIGGFNMHPGPLPRYAGLNAPSWAIYEGATMHAVTIHWLAPGIDTGAIAYERRFRISADDTGLSLSARCVSEGLPLIDDLVAAAGRGDDIPARPQDLRERRYFGRQPPQEGRISWSAPARQIADFVRASDYSPFPSPWGHPTAKLAGREIGIVRAGLTGAPATSPPGTIGEAADGRVSVATGDEWVLLRRLHVDGRYVSADCCLAPGDRLEDG
jgi:methionyl-tRNA formyltransferase